MILRHPLCLGEIVFTWYGWPLDRGSLLESGDFDSKGNLVFAVPLVCGCTLGHVL